jgi:sugar-specific transcriptional regulator TrmB
MEEELRKIGLSPNEARTYLELLKNPESTTTLLAKKLNLHRGYIYDVLDKLIEKGLVGVIKKNGKKHFEAVPPKNIIGFIEQQKKKVDDYEKEFMKILPSLEDIKNKNFNSPKIMLLEGQEAMRNVLEDFLSQKIDLLVFGAAGKFPKEMENYYINWSKRRVKNKIPLKIIYNNKKIAEAERLPEETKFAEKRVLDFDSENPASIIISGNKVALIIWLDKPIITLIENKHASELYRRYFEAFWHMAKVSP